MKLLIDGHEIVDSFTVLIREGEVISWCHEGVEAKIIISKQTAPNPVGLEVHSNKELTLTFYNTADSFSDGLISFLKLDDGGELFLRFHHNRINNTTATITINIVEKAVEL